MKWASPGFLVQFGCDGFGLRIDLDYRVDACAGTIDRFDAGEVFLSERYLCLRSRSQGFLQAPHRRLFKLECGYACGLGP